MRLARTSPLVIVALLSLAYAPLASAQAPPLDGLDAYIEQAMQEWGVPGVAIAVVKDDRVVFAKGYGVRELGKPDPVDENTLFAVASTSKAYTAALLGMLVDEGKVRWDDRVLDHLPDFRLAEPYPTYELTIRDLLSHRSGLPRGDRLWYLSPHDRGEVIRRLRHLEPVRSFRSGYGYQNIMFIAAGEIAGQLMGMSWDEAVRERIFRPLGMTRSSTSVRDLEGRLNVATPHDRLDGEVVPIRWPNYDNLGGAGSINSSAIEMAQWIRLQLGEGVYDGARLLSDSVVKEMHTPQTVIRRDEMSERLYPETHFMAYGLGWTLQDFRGRKVVRHGGSLDGMRTEVALVPEEELGVVVIANLEGTQLPNAIAWRVIDAYLGAPEKDWSIVLLAAYREGRARAEAARAELEAKRVVGSSPSLPIEHLAGTYADSLYGNAVVRVEDGRLVLSLGPNYIGDLEHWHFDTFRATWRDRALGQTFVSFVLDIRGEPAELRVQNLGTFRRVSEDDTRVSARP